MRPSLRKWTAILALAACYFCAGKLGLSWAYVHPSVSAVWPPAGIALAALLLWGDKLWPGIFLGAVLVNITTQGTLATTLGIAVGTTLEALLAVWAINRFANGAKAFERARHIFRFVLIAPVLGTAVGATFGVASLTLTGFAQRDQFGALWLTWWLGDSVGELIFAPLLVIWLTQPAPQWQPKRVAEAAGLLLSVILIGYLIFIRGDPFSPEYIVMLPLLWAAFRFGQRGAVTSALIVSGIALLGTIHGIGPYTHEDTNESLLRLQAFMGTVAIAGLVLAAVTSEGRRAEQRLEVEGSISRILAESSAINQAVPQILQVLCRRAGWDLGAVWIMDRASAELQCIDVWHMPDVSAPEFEAATKRGKVIHGTGLLGRVLSARKAFWTADVAADLNFRRAPLAKRDGLHGALGFPIKLGDEILGVVECFSREVREPDDHFLQVVGDIGVQLGQFIERKRAEDDLRAQRSHLRAIANVTPVRLAQCSRDLRYTFINRAYAAMLGRAPEEIVGRPIVEIIGAEAFEKICPHVETVLRGQAIDYETEIPYKNIGNRFVRVTYMPDRNEQGEVRGWIASITDITERKRAEDEIAALNKQLAIDLAAMTRLQQLGAKLVQTHELGLLVNDILDVAVEIAGADMGTVQLVERGSGALKIVAQRGFQMPFLNFFDTVEEGTAACGQAMLRGERVIVEDVAASPIFAGTAAGSVMLTAGARAVQSTPLVSRTGRLIGVFSTHYRNAHRATERQLTLLDLLARQAADFVERTQTEDLLLHNEELLRAVVETAVDGIITLDEHGTIGSVNPAAELIFGYSSAEMVGQNVRLLMPSDNDLPANLEKVGGGDREVSGRRKDGSAFPVELGIGETRVGDRVIFIGIVRDIGERKRAEEARSKLAAIVESSQDAIISNDLEGVITSWNAGAERLFGYAVEGIVGQAVTRLVPFEYHGEQAELLSRLRRGERVDQYETVRLDCDGRRLDVSLTISPIRDSAGNIIGASTIARDIAGRKRANELLRQARDELVRTNEELERRVQERTADLERANANLIRTIEEQKRLAEQLRQAQKMEIIGTLAGGIAHDFNNILNIIRGYATLMSQEPFSPRSIHESLKVIDQEIDRGAAVVRQLLTVARKTETHLVPTNVNDIVLTLADLIKTFPKTITVSLDLDSRLTPVLADQNQMSQALLNICVNARDAMPAGGRITIRTEKIDADEMRKRRINGGAEAWANIVIDDTGMGMEEEVRARIFEPFFTTKGVGLGTGLGLAIVYGIVKEHHGFIEVESTPGRGTTFRLYLPMPTLKPDETSARDETMEKITAQQSLAKRRGTVLVVEDEEALVHLLEKLLPQAGYQVLAATDGQEALDLYHRHKGEIDIVLLDLGLPKVTGFDVIPKLKEQNPRVSIVIATGYLEPDLKADLLRAGVKDCIHKPYLVNDVLEKLGTALESA